MPFSMNNELYLLKKEIKTFNPEVKLLKNPRWLILKKNKQNKKHTFIIIIMKKNGNINTLN